VNIIEINVRFFFSPSETHMEKKPYKKTVSIILSLVHFYILITLNHVIHGFHIPYYYYNISQPQKCQRRRNV